jgi:hypothetical protein
MKQQIKMPYSDDFFTVEAHHVDRLFNLPIVRISVRGQTISLTTEAAKQIGEALLYVAYAIDDELP